MKFEINIPVPSLSMFSKNKVAQAPMAEACPPQEFFDAALHHPEHTPDHSFLSGGEHSLLFEYGELMQGLPGSKHMNGYPTNEGVAYTWETFELWLQRKGMDTLAIATQMASDPQLIRSKVRGQLFTVPSDHIEKIDSYRENGVIFNRRRTRILLDRPDRVVSVHAWIYTGVPDVWKPQVNWDQKFYSHQRDRTFSPAQTFPDKRSVFNDHYQFTRDCCRKVSPKCFIHLKNDDYKPTGDGA